MRSRAALLPLVMLLLLGSCSDDSSPAGDAALREGGAADLLKPDQPRADGSQTCDEMKAELDVQVELAKICQPQSSSKECTRLIRQDKLPCGCAVYVNPANVAALARIDDLIAAWRRKSCGAKIECKTCPTPTTGSCEATPAGSKAPGLCKSSS